MAIVPTQSQGAIAGAEAVKDWSQALTPGDLEATAKFERDRMEDAAGPGGTYGWVTPGKQAVHAFSDILENLVDLGGTFLAISDGDLDENDWQSNGRRITDNVSKWIDSVANKYAPLHYEAVSWDQAKESFSKGNIGDMFRFMRDSTPQAAVYMGTAMWLKGVPLFASETQRVLDERMSRQGKTTGDADVSDFVYATSAAAFNVFLERLPILKAMKYAGKMPKFKYLSTELGTELMQGTAEEILATVDTAAGVDISEAMDQGLAEMVGGIGVIGATTYTVAGSANKRNIKLREAIATAKVDAASTIDSDLKIAKDAIDADEALTIRQKLKQKTKLDSDAKKKKMRQVSNAYRKKIGLKAKKYT